MNHCITDSLAGEGTYYRIRTLLHTHNKFRSDRKALGKKKKLNAIRTSKNKEQRWMEDQDHKVSRAIVNFAKENKISVIA